MSKVYCDKCLQEIKIRDDLVTSTLAFEVVPYHEDCYDKDLKGAKTFFLSNKPLNGFSGNFSFILAIILAIGWLLFASDTTK
ncbi:hypothetical protein GH741_01050 [Aquibacillus halophilus]|uniref:Uncharacterized protein n=1 Tax=Aquibacillus halophilus TaxID=930132 RepID=A0A6A8DEB6_9BACI|nr:hypothetical protein [Aquibacillus halophilus]MRH41257.1 hypothetical protein [Aquibacillus halophilus]